MANQMPPIRGFRDLYPQDKTVQNYLFEKLKAVAYVYGYEPIDGPLLEPIELYIGKSSQELVEEQTFKMKDKNDETLIMRPEWTPSLARMIANKAGELVFPLKTFNLGLRYRYEAPQKGRSREFYQADYDILGTENVLADAEIVATAVKLFLSLGATEKDFVVYLNSREYVNNKFDELNLKNKKELLSVIDKREKLSREKFIELLQNEKLSQRDIDNLLAFLDTPTDAYFAELLKRLEEYGVAQYCKVNPNIVRGLDYYTGLVFEVKEIGEMKRSLLGGGRYNNLVSTYNEKLQIPGVGFATSDVVLLEFMKDKNLTPLINAKPTKYLVTTTGRDSMSYAIEVTQKLRESGVSTELYPDTEKKLDKQIKYADRNNIPFVIIIGSEEVAKRVIKIKDLETTQQQEVSFNDIVKLG